MVGGMGRGVSKVCVGQLRTEKLRSCECPALHTPLHTACLRTPLQVSKPAILAPVVGILVGLWRAQRHAEAGLAGKGGAAWVCD